MTHRTENDSECSSVAGAFRGAHCSHGGGLAALTVTDDYLFIESGGFSDKNPVGWKSLLIVMKRAGKQIKQAFGTREKQQSQNAKRLE